MESREHIKPSVLMETIKPASSKANATIPEWAAQSNRDNTPLHIRLLTAVIIAGLLCNIALCTGYSWHASTDWSLAFTPELRQPWTCRDNKIKTSHFAGAVSTMLQISSEWWRPFTENNFSNLVSLCVSRSVSVNNMLFSAGCLWSAEAHRFK